MPIHNIYSKRQRELRGETPDVYDYDRCPKPLRVQIVHIISNVLGNHNQYEETHKDRYGLTYDLLHSNPKVRMAYDFIVDTLCHEYGIFQLPASHSDCDCKMNNLLYFFLQVGDIEQAIDVVELSFNLIDERTRDFNYLGKNSAEKDADDAINELNARFKEHGIGYCFTDGRIIRIDSEFIHSEVVLPALKILDQERYSGAQQEFLAAHDHYRHGNTKEALNECLKSLESVMKSICDSREWPYDERATANNLVEICFENNLIPSFWQAQFNALRSLLVSGVPTARNKLSGHGQGAEPSAVPDYIAGYVLHLTAAAIVFLAKAEVTGGN